MDLFTQLFGGLLAFVCHCFDRIVIYGYLSGLSRPERVVNFFRQVVGVPMISKEILSQRTADYQNWVEAFARNHRIPIEWAEKGVRKEDHVLPWQRRMRRHLLEGSRGTASRPGAKFARVEVWPCQRNRGENIGLFCGFQITKKSMPGYDRLGPQQKGRVIPALFVCSRPMPAVCSDQCYCLLVASVIFFVTGP